jgi:hypothetical protein
MLLMAKLIQFPSHYNRSLFVLAMVLIYVFFCIPKTWFDETVWWYLQTYNDYLLIGSMAFVGCVEIQNKLIKSVFFAIIWDSIFSIINFSIFADEYNAMSSLFRNGSMVVSFFYAYLVLFGDRKR